MCGILSLPLLSAFITKLQRNIRCQQQVCSRESTATSYRCFQGAHFFPQNKQ